MKLTIINETLIEYRFSHKISLKISEEVLTIYDYLNDNLDSHKIAVTEITPTFNTIAIAFESCSPLFNDPDYLRAFILQAREVKNIPSRTTHTIETNYNGLDLDEACQLLHLSKKEFISIHQKNTYTIAMLGFKGNFPYLLGFINLILFNFNTV